MFIFFMKSEEYININTDCKKFNKNVRFDLESVLKVIDDIIFDISKFNQYNHVFSNDIAKMTKIKNKILETKSKKPDLFC